MELLNDVVKTKHGEIPTTLIKKNQHSKKLAVVLPGAGYTANAPLLHYSTGVYLHKGFDVFHVKYNYPKDIFTNMSDEDFAEEVITVINSVKNEYEEFVFITKSLGTLALAHIIETANINISHNIWLTPLIHMESVYQKMLTSKYKGLVIIGDEDPCYNEERYHTFTENTLLTTHLIKGTNHALEYSDDPVNSVNVLKEIVNIMNEYN
ncbi:alpha/beta hydrolase [Bacillaceae bacterium W0354]